MKDLDEILGIDLECGNCPLSGNLPVRGIGPKPCEVMLVGEAPGQDEVNHDPPTPFVGVSGRLLRHNLQKVGLDIDDVYITNVVKCHPPNNRNPKASEIKICFSNLKREIRQVNPKLLVAVGNIALKTLTGQTGITRLSGKLLKTKSSTGIGMTEGIDVMPLIHPAAIFHNQRLIGEFQEGISNIQKILKNELTQIDESGNYIFMQDIQKVRDIFRTKILIATAVAIDVETSDKVWADKFTFIKSIGFCWAPHYAAALHLKDSSGKITWTEEEYGEIKDLLKQLLHSRKIEKIMHNCSFDQNYIALKLGIETKSPIFDTKIAQFLVNENTSNILKDMAWRVTNMGGYEGDLEPQHKQGSDLLKYNCQDCSVTYQAYLSLKEELIKERVDKVFRDLLMPVRFSLAAMERRGIRIDMVKLQSLHKDVAIAHREVGNTIKAHPAINEWRLQHPGISFNPSSTIHLREVLFDILKMPISKKTPTGLPSVDRETIEYLAGRDPLVDRIAEYKDIQKIESTYITGMLDKIYDNRIHTQYLLWGVRSGRTASRSPNLQNLPHTKAGINIRDLFIADPNCEFIEVDYNQHELRVMASVSNDPVMQHIFQQDLDIHTETAKSIFKTDTPTDEMRRDSKTINFGVLYGMGAYLLSKTLECSVHEAEIYIMNFYRKFWGVHRWKNEVERFVRRHGYVETLTGRRRRFPTMDGNLSDHEIREAINTLVQGLASDLLLYSIVGIDRMFRYCKMVSSLCAQVHDSILINVYNGEQKQVRDICRNVMLNPPIELKVPLKITFAAGSSWGSLVKES